MPFSPTMTKRVLIVDDSSTMRAMLHETIADQAGFKVVGLAKSGQEALDLMDAVRPDIITIDLCMPYIDGSRLLEMLRDHPRVVKVVLSSSANASEAVQGKLRELGASAFFDKKAVAQDPSAFREKLFKLSIKRPASGGERAEVVSHPLNVIFAANRFPLARDEAARLDKLAALNIANLVPDSSLDIIVRHVARSVRYPILAATLIDADRLWVKAAVGIDRHSRPREDSFCAHTLCQDAPLIIADTLAHTTFSTFSTVAGEMHIRAYAGVPIVSRNKVNLGVICAADNAPRRPSASEIAALTDAAGLIAEFLEEPARIGLRAA